MLFYMHGNIKNQIDQGDETEGLEMDGLEGDLKRQYIVMHKLINN